MATSTVTVDDHDAPVVYSGTWLSYHSDEEYMGASTWTSTAGSTAIVTFTGTKITVYGTVGILGINGTIDRSESAYSVDNETVHDWYYSTPTNQLQYQTLFWESDALQLDQHQLTITNVKGSLYLDYFQITTPSGSQNVSGSAATISASSATSSTSLSSATATVTSSTAGARAQKSTVPILAGAIVAGVVVLMLGLFAYLIHRRYRSSFTVKLRDHRVDVFPPSPALDSQMSETSGNSELEAVSPFYASDRRATILSTTTSTRKSQLIPVPRTSLCLVNSSSSRGSKAASFHAGAESDDAQHDPPPSYTVA